MSNQSNDPQHEQLVAAGWTYDQSTDQYREPNAGQGSPTYSRQEAWQRWQQLAGQQGKGQGDQQRNKAE